MKSDESHRRNLDSKEVAVRGGKDKAFNIGRPDTIGQFECDVVGLEGVITRGKLLKGVFDNILGYARGNTRNPLRHGRKSTVAIARGGFSYSPGDAFDEK